MTVISYLKLPDEPCPKCGGISFYTKNRSCVKCVRMATAAKMRERVARDGGIVADHIVRVNNPLEERMMRGVWYE